MFALPYPHEFLRCVCHAKKKPHQQLRATHCPGGGPGSPFAYGPFPCRGHLQIGCPCPRPRPVPGTRRPGVGAVRGGGAQAPRCRRCAAGACRPEHAAVPGWLRLPVHSALGSEHGSQPGGAEKRRGAATGRVTTATCSPLQARGSDCAPAAAQPAACCPRAVCRWLQLTRGVLWFPAHAGFVLNYN